MRCKKSIPRFLRIPTTDNLRFFVNFAPLSPHGTTVFGRKFGHFANLFVRKNEVKILTKRSQFSIINQI
jgi:hypothetical protein